MELTEDGGAHFPLLLPGKGWDFPWTTLHVCCFLRPKYLPYIVRQEEAVLCTFLQMNKQRPEW